MRRFAYIGNHAETTLYGVVFPQGVPTPVEDPARANKLAGNPDFREEEQHDQPAIAPVVSELTVQTPEIREAFEEAPDQRRGRGRPRRN